MALVLLDQKQVNLAQVTGTTAGRLIAVDLAEKDSDLWYPIWSLTYGATPVSVLLNTQVVLGVYWENIGNLPITGKVTATLVKPDSSEVALSASAGQNLTLPVGYWGTVTFGPVTLDKLGQYLLTCKLESV